jgi:hypothetical protein
MPHRHSLREADELRLQLPVPVRERVPKLREPPTERPDRGWGWLLLGWLIQQSGWLISAGMHVGVAAALAVIVWSPPLEDSIGAIDSALLGEEAAAEPFEAPLPVLELSGFEAALATSESAFQSTEAPRDATGTISAGALAGAGDGTGEGSGGGVADISFFGTTGTANSVAFVVDMSGSMEGSRFARARLELIHAIVRLKSTQKFYVVFFNSQTFPLFHPKPATEMVPATSLNKRRATRWINARTPGTSTNADPALRFALALKPDVIFFLTDGEIPPITQVTAKEQNRAGVVINTIAFEGRQGEVILRAMAEENGGTYRYVK